MNEEIKRQKYTTTLNINTINELEELRLYYNKKNYTRIRGLNEVIEIITREKWEEINNDKNSKEKQEYRKE